jgi:hypothetical protein
LEECFTAFLSDSYGDGWNGNVLTIADEGTSEVVHQLTQSGNIDAFAEEAFEVCFECGSCFAADVGGGSFADETSWNIKDAEGGTLASGGGEDDDSGDDDCGGWFGWGCRRRLDDNSNTFCTSACFSTVCEEGQQPNRDDECESCAAGKFKDAAGNAACVECVPGSYSTVVGSVSADDCQQVRKNGRSERNITNVFLFLTFAHSASLAWRARLRPPRVPLRAPSVRRARPAART